MAVSFDHSITTEIKAIDRQNMIKVLTYDGAAFTSAYVNFETTFDYFRDDAEAGDMVYFGWQWEAWHDLKLNIDTPLVATNIDIVWEYLDYNNVWQTLTVVDNSNSFQNSGSQVVEFTPPEGWKYTRLSTGAVARYVYGSFIRARIVSVSGLTEGGANGSVMPDGLDYTMQVTGSEVLSNIYDYDVTNSLGVVTRDGAEYTFRCNFRIGDKVDTPTTFTMLQEKIQIGLSDRLTGNKTLYYGKYSLFAQSNYDTWNMGSAEGKNGCVYVYNTSRTTKNPYNYTRCQLNWYNSFVAKDYGGYGEGGMKGGKKIFENCIFSPYNVFFLIGVSEGSYFKNCVIDIGTTGYWYIYTPKFSFENIQLTVGAGILAQTCTLTKTDYGTKKFYCYSGHNHLIDCSVVDADTQFVGQASSRGYLDYTVNVDVVDELGNPIIANVEIKNDLGVVLYNGDSSIASVINVFYRYWTSGVPTTEDGNPFTITVTKAGYEPYILNKLEILKKTELIVKLELSKINIDQEQL